jgi:hypothetical protein
LGVRDRVGRSWCDDGGVSTDPGTPCWFGPARIFGVRVGSAEVVSGRGAEYGDRDR